MYHWSFAGIGAVQDTTVVSGGLSQSPHLAHQGVLSLMPALSEVSAAGASDASMWVSHAFAAAVTIALMYRGEQAALHLVRVLSETLPARLPLAVRLPGRGSTVASYASPVRVISRRFLGAITHRGPPLPAAA